MFNKTLLFLVVALLAVAQVALADTPPACLLSVIGGTDNPSDVATICKDKAIAAKIGDVCTGDESTTAMSAFVSVCKAAGVTVSTTASASGSASASKTASASASKTASASETKTTNAASSSTDDASKTSAAATSASVTGAGAGVPRLNQPAAIFGVVLASLGTYILLSVLFGWFYANVWTAWRNRCTCQEHCPRHRVPLRRKATASEMDLLLV